MSALASSQAAAGAAWIDEKRWHYRRSLASRVILLTTIAVGLTVALVATGTYLTARRQLQDTLDQALLSRAEAAASDDRLRTLINDLEIPPWALGAADVRMAYLYNGASGSVSRAFDRLPYLQFGKPEIAVAKGSSASSIRTIIAGGQRYRVVAVQTQVQGLALILAQSLKDQDRVLSKLGIVMLGFGGAGVIAAGVAGWLVARNGLRPVRRLTTSVEDIARTEDLTPLPIEGDDEIARLAAAFNQMLVALDASRSRQRQLVADAGHELRTPLTSMRTNIDLLAQADSGMGLPVESRRELLDDISAQMEELTTLIGDLTELARDERTNSSVGPVDLSDVLEQAIARVRRRAPSVTFNVESEHWFVTGEEPALARAVTNLLDNAAKWSPAGGQVDVRLTEGVLIVDDQGPGIAEADRGKVFDRFWRSQESRTLPGSGLGLSIVRQVAERHAGVVWADASPSGGARLQLRLPGHALVDA